MESTKHNGKTALYATVTPNGAYYDAAERYHKTTTDGTPSTRWSKRNYGDHVTPTTIDAADAADATDLCISVINTAAAVMTFVSVRSVYGKSGSPYMWQLLQACKRELTAVNADDRRDAAATRRIKAARADAADAAYRVDRLAALIPTAAAGIPNAERAAVDARRRADAAALDALYLTVYAAFDATADRAAVQAVERAIIADRAAADANGRLYAARASLATARAEHAAAIEYADRAAKIADRAAATMPNAYTDDERAAAVPVLQTVHTVKYRFIQTANGKRKRIECRPHNVLRNTIKLQWTAAAADVATDAADLIQTARLTLWTAFRYGLISNVNTVWNCRHAVYTAVQKAIHAARAARLELTADATDANATTFDATDAAALDAFRAVERDAVINDLWQTVLYSLDKRVNVDAVRAVFDCYIDGVPCASTGLHDATITRARRYIAAAIDALTDADRERITDALRA